MKIIIPIYITMIALSFWFYFEVQHENQMNFELQKSKSIRSESIENDINPKTNSHKQKTEPSLAEKKVMCLRMFGGGDLSAWETAQAECMLQQSESACECMQLLVQ